MYPARSLRSRKSTIPGRPHHGPSGKELPPSELSGDKVDLHMVNGKIAAVIIYPSMVE